MNLGEAKKRAIKLIAEWSNNGNLISDSANADYILRMNALADAAQKEIATIKKIPSIFHITQNRIPNQLGVINAMDMKLHLNSDIIDSAIGSRAYYFEIDNIATVYVEEKINGAWITHATINNTTKRVFTAYQGLIPITDRANEVRIRYSGQYPYSIQNRALYEYDFPTAEDVPTYSTYVKYEMPLDFMELQKVIYIHDSLLYGPANDYYWEDNRTFVANSFMVGAFQVHYWRFPKTIDDNTPDSYEFEVDVVAQELIPYYIAAHVSMDEPQKQNMVSTYLNLYQSKLVNLAAKSPVSAQKIENVYGW